MFKKLKKFFTDDLDKLEEGDVNSILSEKEENIIEELEKEIEEEDKEIEKKKKSIEKKNKKNKKKKEDYETIGDVEKKRKNIVTSYIAKLTVVGLLLMAVAAGIMTYSKIQKQREIAIKQEKNKKPVKDIVLGNGNDNLWKLEVDNQIKNLHKNIIKLKNDVNKSLVDYQKQNRELLESFAKNIEKEMQKNNENLKMIVNKVTEEQNKKIDNLKRFVINKTLQTKIEIESKIKKKPTYLPVPKLPPLNSNKNTKIKSVAINNNSKKNNSNINNKTNNQLSTQEEVVEVVDNVSIENIPLNKNVKDTNMVQPKKQETKAPYHIMTGFVKGTLITGVSAPTFSSGVQNPKPVLITLDGKEIIANNQTENLKDCIAIGSATGNMNSSRAEILITRISCSIPTSKEGIYKKIEISGSPIGWVIGEDGKYGLKGRLVDSSGKVILRQIMVGFLQGVANAFAPAASVTVTNPTNVLQNLQTGTKSGVAQGTSNAFNTLAQYYKKMLDGMYPYVDVMAGRKVTVLIKGFQDVKVTEYRKIDVTPEETEEDYESSPLVIDNNGF